MMSRSGVDRLVDELRFAAGRPVGDEPGRRSAPDARRGPPLDFDSGERWPDLPYDTGALAARYDAASQARLRAVVDDAGERMAAHAPAARNFVVGQLDRVLLRRSDRLAAAASGSNRACVGRCILTNLHLEADPAAIAIESLVHESIHQRIYRLEAAEGGFCDLGGPSVLRSPWTGSRLPLHSLVHATFVWFGLAMLWTRFGRDPHAAERLTHCRFGFQFLGDVIEAPSFPHASVRRDVLDGMRGVATEVLRSAYASPAPRASAQVAA